MIGSFWSLCRACPSMPVDKLHSEYRSTYRWHEYTGPRQEVVRRAPQGGQANAMPPNEERRIEFQQTRIDEESHEMPKLEPAMPRRKKYPDLAYRHHEFVPGEARNHHDAADGGSADRARGRDSGLLKKAISKISTEYRLQFAWPQGHTSRRDAAADAPRKSQSMGALKPAANAMIHRKRNECEPRDGNASELEPLVNDSNTIKEEEYKPEAVYNKDFKPYARGVRKEEEKMEEQTVKHLMQNGDAAPPPPKSEWIRECVELRKKAGEYKNRGWGSKLAPELDIYNKQVELWDQVSRRSSLSALSLASTAHRNYTKEEKDHENTKKSSPTKALRNAENSRLMKDMIRHHLERTTGGTEFDGLILSPTREKLEPTIPKRDDDSRGSQKNSPKKGSPQKTALQKKNSLKSKSALKTARSQSVGPSDMTSTEKRSPKRQSRPATVTAAKDKKAPSPAAPSVAVNGVATPTTNNTPAVKRPRPSSLNTTTTTTASSRSKRSSVPSRHEDERLVKSKSNKNCSNETNAHARDRRRERSASEKTDKGPPEVNEPDPIDLEPVVKSPPEPTRVKSPEQIMIRSPDPVNWTVPLDTGKTFTVTQNVREGDLAARPHSEIKAWTPPDLPPPIAQSAPPQLTEQPCKEPGMS